MTDRGEKMKIILDQIERKDKDICYRLLQYSLFEESISDFNEMNEKALFEYEGFDDYFTNGDASAYFMREKETRKIVGFIMVNKQMQRFETGHCIAEFMVIPKYRRNKIGKAAAVECFNLFTGSWEVSPSYGSEKAYLFWKHVIDEYTDQNNTFEQGMFMFTSSK